MPTVNKPTEIKCKFDKRASVNVMSLITCQLVNLSELSEHGNPIDGYGQDKIILKGYDCNPSIYL